MTGFMALLLVMVVLTAVLLLVLSQWLTAPAAEMSIKWVSAEDQIFKENDRLIQDHSFVIRVAEKVRQMSGCQAVTDGDLIRVYRDRRLVGVVKCLDTAAPDDVTRLAELREHLRVQTAYLAAAAPVGIETKAAAKLQKVKIITGS